MPQEPDLSVEKNPGVGGFLRPSALGLILANCWPIYGVLVLEWKVFPVIFLFWLENLVIGVLNVLRMLIAAPRNQAYWVAKAFLIPFFCIHFGLFAFVHGVLVMGFFGGMFRTGAPFPGTDIIAGFIRQYQLGWPIIALAASHSISFILNYVGEGEYLRANPLFLMQQPYGRVVVLHVTILAGGFLITLLNAPIAGLLLLVVLKTGLDLRAHLREHQAVSPATS